jgi:hypothetical protein
MMIPDACQVLGLIYPGLWCNLYVNNLTQLYGKSRVESSAS